MSKAEQMSQAKAKLSHNLGNSRSSKPEEKPKLKANATEVLAHYDSSRGTYWTRNSKQDWIQFTESALKRRLRLERYGDIPDKYLQVMQADKDLLKMQTENDVSYAGPIAGYRSGIHEICGQRILVTEGPKLIKWAHRPWPNLKRLIQGMFGDNAPILYGWLNCALRSLYAGPPFRPGQMFAIAGPAGCGKSLLQNLITEAFGGRSAKPYRYLVGDTSFNSDLMRAEHLMIEDDASSTDPRSRKSFGTMLKNLIVNETQSLHRKGRDAISVTPFIRVSISLNDEPENLMVLPPMEESLKDKVILLRASKPEFIYADDDLAQRKLYREELTAELPGFIAFVRDYRIPERMKSQRYGMIAYQEPSLLKDLMELAPEWKLLSIIDSLGIWEYGQSEWSGTASALEELLRSRDKTGMVKDLCWFSTACGVFLKSISVGMPDRVSCSRIHGGARIWTIKKPI